MNVPQKTKLAKKDILTIIAMLALVSFIFRLWPVIILMIVGLFVALVILLLRADAKPEIIEPKQATPIPRPEVRLPDEKDVYTLAYSVIIRRITQLVLEKYPNARWIWEAPNARSLIESGSDVYILLNSAGGYNRAKVNIFNLQVTDIVFGAAKEDEFIKEDDTFPETEDIDEDIPENYELIAYEWVNSHIIDLNNRCNEALGENQKHVLITAEELPAKESWMDICKQLQKNEIKNLECVPDGIQINFTHHSAERNL